MDKASAPGAGDSRFESWADQKTYTASAAARSMARSPTTIATTLEDHGCGICEARVDLTGWRTAALTPQAANGIVEGASIRWAQGRLDSRGVRLEGSPRMGFGSTTIFVRPGPRAAMARWGAEFQWLLACLRRLHFSALH